MNELDDIFHGVHGAIFCTFAVFYVWAWIRGGFWLPQYVHGIALGALVAGVIVTMTLPEPTNPSPVVKAFFPLIFPAFFVVSTYAIAILCGYVHLAERLRAPANARPDDERDRALDSGG